MVEELIKYLSDPGDIIVDPFGGSGTLLVGLTIGRDVRLIELNPEYAELCRKNEQHIIKIADEPQDEPRIKEGPNQEVLSTITHDSVQAFIFSPPYAGALAEAGGKLADWGGYTREHTSTYSDTSLKQGNQSPFNLGGFNNFMFNQEMKKIYKLCLTALKPGGYTCCIIKDRMKGGVKEELGYRAMQDMIAQGYEVYDWQRLYMPGSHYTKYHRSLGRQVIEEEHLIIMRKPL